MKKQTLLLSALALSIGLSLSVLPPAAASLPTQVPGRGALPSPGADAGKGSAGGG